MIGQNTWADELAHILSLEDTVLFIGSGISRNSGLPNWGEFVTGLIEHFSHLQLNLESAEEECGLKRYDIAAGNLEHILSENGHSLTDYFLKDKRFKDAEPNDIHKMLIQLGLSSFLTINYDQLIEKEYDSATENSKLHCILNDSPREIATLLDQNAQNFIFKYHGDIDQPNSLVITDIHYQELMYSNKPVMKALEYIFCNRNIVLWGIGTDDGDLHHVLSNIKYNKRSRKNSILRVASGMSESDCNRYYGKYEIPTVVYSVTGNDHLTPLVKLLEHLILKVAQIRQQRSNQIELDGKISQDDGVETIYQDYRKLAGEDSLSDMILSTLFWTGASKHENLVTSILEIDSSISERAITAAIQSLEAQGILFTELDRIYPSSLALAGRIGNERIEDALILGGI